MANRELDALDPQPGNITLSTGIEVEILPLRTRQFFKLLRIVTRGALPQIQDMGLFKVGADMDPGEFAGRLTSLLLLSIPEAENEAIEFIQAMCRPTGLIQRHSGMKLNKQDVAHNTEKWSVLFTDLDNPELDDLVTVIEAVVKRESADLLALGKRLSQMFKIAEKTGQVTTSPTSQTSYPSQSSPAANYSAASPAHTTSSNTSTAGATTASVIYLSDGSGSSSQPSPSDGSGSSGATSSE
jgi:hypothetical protein